MIKLTEAEAIVLETRDIPIATLSGGEASYPWAVHLAAAELFDCEHGKRLEWRKVWDLAVGDTDWRRATDELIGRLADPRDPFAQQWVDMWLLRHFKQRAYLQDDNMSRVLRKLGRG